MDRQRIWELVEAQREFLVSTRREIHQHPELSFEEKRTAALVASVLTNAGYAPKTGVGSGGTGVWAVLEGGLPGPTIALRADTDALPVDERNDLPFRSQNPGVMHACGHDAHTAILLATARALKEVEQEVPGHVVMLFQHAEEFPPGGAIELIEAGCLEGVDAAFGLHQSPREDVGRLVVAPGRRAASSDTFRLAITGRGGHGAAPHRTIDPVQVGAALVTSLHHIVSRRIDPLEPAVITVGTFQAGTKENVIADTARITGTVRAFSQDVRELLHREIEAVAKGVTASWGATFEMEYIWGYPVLSNDDLMAELGARAAELVLGKDAVGRTAPAVMGAEDFAHYLNRVPGAFASLGSGVASVPEKERPAAHSAGFMMEEGALPVGMAWYLSLVSNFETLRAELAPRT
jgi:amidohydrolase